MRKNALRKYFNWRVMLVRILVNALILALTVLILPNARFVSPSLFTWFILALALGVLNAIVKPLIQILTLPFIFATYGLIVVLINAVILILLALLFPNLFEISSVWAALLGGVIMGILSSLLESLLGVSPPILPDADEEFRRQVELQTTSLSSIVLQPKEEPAFAAAGSGATLVTTAGGAAASADLSQAELASVRASEPAAGLTTSPEPQPGAEPKPEDETPVVKLADENAQQLDLPLAEEEGDESQPDAEPPPSSKPTDNTPPAQSETQNTEDEQ